MKSPPSFSPRRAFGRGGAVPKTGVEAAAALLRTEFERLRHRRERARLASRMAEADRALALHDARARQLCHRILGGEEDAG